MTTTTATATASEGDMKRDEKARAALLHSADTIVARLNRTMKEWDSKGRLIRDNNNNMKECCDAKERLKDMDVPPSSNIITPRTTTTKAAPLSPQKTKRNQRILDYATPEEEEEDPAMVMTRRHSTDGEQQHQVDDGDNNDDDDDFDVMKVVRKRIQMANRQQQSAPAQLQTTPSPEQQLQTTPSPEQQQETTTTTTTTTTIQRQMISVPQVQPGAYSGAPGEGFRQQECIRFSLVGALPKDGEEQEEQGGGGATTDIEAGGQSPPQQQQHPQPPEILVEASLVTSTVQRGNRHDGDDNDDDDDNVIKTNVVEAKELTIRDVLQIKGVCYLFGAMISCFLIILGVLVAALIVAINNGNSSDDDNEEDDQDYYEIPPAPLPDESGLGLDDPYYSAGDDEFPPVEPDDPMIGVQTGDDDMFTEPDWVPDGTTIGAYPATFAPTSDLTFSMSQIDFDDNEQPPNDASSAIEDPAVVAICIAAALVVVAMIVSIPIFLTYMKRKLQKEQQQQQQQQLDREINHDIESPSKITNKERQQQRHQLGTNSDTEKLGVNSDDTDDSKMTKSTLPSKESSLQS